MSDRLRFLALHSALVILACSSLFAASATQPTLRVDTHGGQTTFRIGERIPLDLSFSGPDTQEYEITLASYDRSGRMRYEDFKLSPSPKWADPLASYFIGGFAGGGLRSLGRLSSKPIVMTENLNEWVRFDQPGTYQITVLSYRVGRAGPGTHRETILRSNPIELRIVAAPARWQHERLEAILSTLRDVPDRAGIPPSQRTDAIADLRFLGTPDAIRALVASMQDDTSELTQQSGLGLAGLPAPLHSFALARMDEAIDDPAFPVCGWFLSVLGKLQYDPETPPPQDWNELQKLDDGNWHRVLTALSGKEGRARAVTAATLLDRQPKDLSPEAKAQFATILLDSFNDLPKERQAAELQWNWDILRSPAMLPTLRALAQQPLAHPGSNEMNNYTTRELKAAALKRWYELDPASATSEALSQVGSVSPSLTAADVDFLPPGPHPEFESIWVQALLDNDDDYEQEAVFASLLTRFGTGAASPQIEAKLQDKVGEWACAPQAAALAYLVKFHSEQARNLLHRAVAARGEGKTACNHSIFQDVSASAHSNVLTEEATAALEDPDTKVVNDAVIYLMSYDTRATEQPLWARYERWSDRWAGKAEQLQHRDAGSLTGNWQEIGLGRNLGRALIASQGWLADDSLISRVLVRCVGEQMCQQLKLLAPTPAHGPYPVIVSEFDSVVSYHIAQYESKSADLFEEKVAQFPRGTVFSIVPTTPQTEHQKQIETEAAAVLAAHGMSQVR